MTEILIAVLVIGVVGLLLGLAMVFAGKKFAVEVDDRVTQVRDALRGANCGACGYAGCDALAEAIVRGDAHMDGCPGNSTENIAKIAAVLGKTAVSQEPQVAYVRCGGNCEATQPKAEYVGITDCRAAVMNGLEPMSCAYGCLGLGTCASVCPQGAIAVVNGVATVDPAKCFGCGLCVKACPKHLVGMKPRGKFAVVHCSNPQRGPAVKKICTNGCIGCGLCAKQCEFGAITMENNLPVVDTSKCTGCGKCAEKCPTGSIALGR